MTREGDREKKKGGGTPLSTCNLGNLCLPTSNTPKPPRKSCSPTSWRNGFQAPAGLQPRMPSACSKGETTDHTLLQLSRPKIGGTGPCEREKQIHTHTAIYPGPRLELIITRIHTSYLPYLHLLDQKGAAACRLCSTKQAAGALSLGL